MNEFENRLSRQMNTRKQRKIGDIHGCEIELNRKEKDRIGHVKWVEFCRVQLEAIR